MLNYKVRTGGQILLVPIEDILPPEETSRMIVSAEELKLLAQSLKTSGIITPVTVRDAGEGRYSIISGERRRKAALMAGFSHLPCVLVASDGIQACVYELVDNLHRKELHFIEAARAIDRLRDVYSVETIAELLSIPEGMILSRLRLLTLPDNIKWKIVSAGLSENIANSLSRITDYELMNDITELIIASGMDFNEASKVIRDSRRKNTVCVTHYKDLTVFENTVEHAIHTMNESGISADSQKTVTDTHIIYTVTIKKMI